MCMYVWLCAKYVQVPLETRRGYWGLKVLESDNNILHRNLNRAIFWELDYLIHSLTKIYTQTVRCWHILTLSKHKCLLPVKAERELTFNTQPYLISTQSTGHAPVQQRRTAFWAPTPNYPCPVNKAGSTWNENRKQLFDSVHRVHQHHSVLLVSQLLLSLINHFGHLSHS